MFGQNKAFDMKDTRIEGVFELGYKVNKNLSLEGWYSYINSSLKDAKWPHKVDNTQEGSKNQNKSTVRLQALYKF